jgi:methyl-accepting chemotaxis protein
MNLSAIKIKIITLIFGVGLILSFLLAVYSPKQAQKLGNEILRKDTEFIANLLAENLALGMQTRGLDDGATLDQTLGLLKQGKGQSAISDVWVYDENRQLVAGLNNSASAGRRTYFENEFELKDDHDILKATLPLRDSYKNIIGYVEIDYSKQFLNDRASRNSFNALLISLAAIIAIAILGIWLGAHVARRIQQVTAVIKDLAKGAGDLTRRLDSRSSDEIGELARWFNIFMDKLHDIIAQVAINTKRLSEVSIEVSATSRELASGAKEQTNQNSQVSSAVEEIAASIIEATKSTGNAAHKAHEASDFSQKGSRLANDASRGMENIVVSTEMSARNIDSLSEKATAIGKVIKVIDDIADQTNLLALNAAIEAARAGDQGRGFAVVADEVRKLADRTTKATGEVAETIKGIQADVTSANAQIRESGETVGQGRELVKQTNESLNEIFAAIETVQAMMSQVATASEQQSAAIGQISSNIETTTRISQESVIKTDQALKAAEILSCQAEELGKLVGGFKLRDSTLADLTNKA